MENVKKNIITRESIAKDLAANCRGDFAVSLFLSILLSVIFIPMIIGCFYALFWEVNDVIFAVAKVVICLIFIVALSLPIILNVIPLVSAIIKKRKVKRGEFDVIVSELSYKREVYVRKSLEQRLVFAQYGEVAVGGTEYQLAAMEDEYYLVFFCGKKNIEALYPLKTNEFVEE
jgi:hypothetical protein